MFRVEVNEHRFLQKKPKKNKKKKQLKLSKKIIDSAWRAF